jgi:Mg2+-importing ATPase
MNILCTDKTGTITQDKIELVKCVDYQGRDSAHVFEMAFLNSSLQSGIANPLDQAIIAHKKLDISSFKKLDELPFDFERRRMSVVVEKNDLGLIITKGAPEFMITQAKYLLRNGKLIKLDAKTKKEFVDQYRELSRRGYRVLAIGSKKIDKNKRIYNNFDENNLILAGFTAFLDPVKLDAKKAIEELEEIGIEIKVVTGDNELVTQRACQEADIKVRGVLLGSQIAKMSEHELELKATQTTIFARVSPTEKERVILALKRAGNVVGYMGDGINDALSLNAADIGISVDNAVDVAKESADFILTNKSLRQLREGVIEGRVIFGNTMKYIMMGLSSNYGNMFSVLGAVLFLPFLPMLPIQLLLNNFLYDFSQIAIPTDKVDSEYLVAPKKWDIGFIRRFMMVFGPISSVFDFLTFFVLYKSFSSQPHLFQTGWFMESLASQVLAIYIIRTRKIPFIQSSPSRALLVSTLAMVGVGWIIPYTRVASYFSLFSIPLSVLVILAFIVMGYLICLELGKRLFFRWSYSRA